MTVRGWDAWDEVVLVLSNVDRTGIGYDYEAVVEYDPGLVDDVGPPPLASLGPVWPNPFRPAGHGAARIPFALHRPSAAGSLTLYAADGRRVRQFALGARSARRHLLSWDGTNESGEPVGSGIYYAVLEAEGVVAAAAAGRGARPLRFRSGGPARKRRPPRAKLGLPRVTLPQPRSADDSGRSRPTLRRSSGRTL